MSSISPSPVTWNRNRCGSSYRPPVQAMMPKSLAWVPAMRASAATLPSGPARRLVTELVRSGNASIKVVQIALPTVRTLPSPYSTRWRLRTSNGT
jgi:hypothetical protein